MNIGWSGEEGRKVWGSGYLNVHLFIWCSLMVPSYLFKASCPPLWLAVTSSAEPFPYPSEERAFLSSLPQRMSCLPDVSGTIISSPEASSYSRLCRMALSPTALSNDNSSSVWSTPSPVEGFSRSHLRVVSHRNSQGYTRQTNQGCTELCCTAISQRLCAPKSAFYRGAPRDWRRFASSCCCCCCCCHCHVSC